MGGPIAWEWMIYFGLPATLEAIIVAGAVYLGVRFGLKKVLSGTGSSNPETACAMEIVRARYARGEISRREYEQLRDDLEAKESGELLAQKRHKKERAW